MLGRGRVGAVWRKVYHLLGEEDLPFDFRGRSIFVLWPGDGLWYEAHIERRLKRDRSVKIVYMGTEEEEDADLNELVSAKQLAVVELRPPGVAMGERDVSDGGLELATTAGSGGEDAISESGSENGCGKGSPGASDPTVQVGKRSRGGELDVLDPNAPEPRKAKKAKQDGPGIMDVPRTLTMDGSLETLPPGMIKDGWDLDDQVQEVAAMEHFTRNLLASIVGRQSATQRSEEGRTLSGTMLMGRRYRDDVWQLPVVDGFLSYIYLFTGEDQVFTSGISKISDS